MATRDESTREIECSKCGNRGEAQTSEDDHPWMTHGNFQIDYISETFSVCKSSKRRHEIELKCGECGSIFRPFG